ncbi:GlsB/YeaQ/YmgE family stress response membrane protein, partial [Methylobacterium sp. E-005]|uniref:GlsB/YeaQ/YmgE family stress response membrane protein n=1 Tax=Methylobacterium sp. E-005 TaxID=2836549 RepID=UPI001FB8EA52
MSLLAWIVLGLVAGFIGSKVVNNTGQGLVVDILLGVVGAVVGGFLFNQFGEPGVSGFNLYSLLVAVVGAVIVLV